MSGPWEDFQGPWSDFKPVKKAGPWDAFAKAMSAESELAVAGSGTAAALAAGAVAFPAAGIAGLGALKAGGGEKEVYEAMEATNKALSPELSPVDEAAVRKLMYPLEALNKGATAAQEYVTEKTGSKIAGATVGTGIEAGALLLGPKVAGKAKEGVRRVVTDIKELKSMEGPWAEFKTPDMSRTAKPWEEFKAEEVKPVEEVKPEIKAEEIKTEPAPVSTERPVQWWMEDRGIYAGGIRQGETQFLIERGKGGFRVSIWEQDPKTRSFAAKQIGTAKKVDEAKSIAENYGKEPKTETASEPVVETKPQEPPSPSGVEPTSAKNAVTTAERGERGLDPVESEARRTTPMYEEGKRLVDAGERDPRALAKSIVDKPRDLTPEETGALVYDRMMLKNEHKATMDAVDKAIDSGDTIAEAEARTKLDAVEEALNTSDTALKRAGTEWSATGRMRQMLVAQDYSLAAMVQKHKVKTGKAPSAETRAKYEKWSKELEAVNKELESLKTQNAELIAAKSVEKIKVDVAKEQRQTRRVRAKQELSVEFDSLVKDLNKALGGQLNVGLDPTAVVIIGKMAKNRVQAGYITAEALVDHIYTAIKKTGIEVSKRDIRDAISGYGHVPSKATRSELTAQMNELKKELRQISKAEDIKSGTIDPDAAQRKALKTRTENRIKDLERRLKEGDFSKKERKPLELGKAELELKFRKDKIEKAFNEELIKNQRASMTPLKKAGWHAWNSLNEYRTVRTSFDLSAVLRQGAFIVYSHPIKGVKALPSMFKALKSEKGQFSIDQEILQRPNYDLYEKSNLYLSEHGQKLSKMEESYMAAGYAEKIPGVGASQRAYTTYLNKIRADVFDTMIGTLTRRKGTPTLEEAKIISNYINKATGRGSFGVKDRTSVAMNTVLFAPRYVASRFQMALLQPLWSGKWKGTGQARRMIAEEYGRFLTGIAAVYGVGIAAGGEVESDMRSSDFGKIRFGKTRIDPTAGMSQAAVLLARIITGEYKNEKGRIVALRDSLTLSGGKRPFGGKTPLEIGWRFMQSKFSPAAGITADIINQQNYVGQPLDETYALEQVLPLVFNDIRTSMETNGVAATAALAVLSIFGLGVQTYEEKRRR